MGSILGSEELSRMKKNSPNMAAVIPKDQAHDIAIRCRSSACNVIIVINLSFLGKRKSSKNRMQQKKEAKDLLSSLFY